MRVDLTFHEAVAAGYTSGPQKIRNLSEHWVGREIYCPSCGHTEMTQHGNNRPVADFFCGEWRADYELKTQARMFGASVTDGAHRTMIERLNSSSNPNLLLLHYNQNTLSVVNLVVVPKYLFTPAMIVNRPPLSPGARRGWLDRLQDFTRRNSRGGSDSADQRPRYRTQIPIVLEKRRRTLFIQDQKDVTSKGWLLSVMKCIDRLGKLEFSLSELYQFEEELRMISTHQIATVKEKMRQKLQILRDKGFFGISGSGGLPA